MIWSWVKKWKFIKKNQLIIIFDDSNCSCQFFFKFVLLMDERTLLQCFTFLLNGLKMIGGCGWSSGIFISPLLSLPDFTSYVSSFTFTALPIFVFPPLAPYLSHLNQQHLSHCFSLHFRFLTLTLSSSITSCFSPRLLSCLWFSSSPQGPILLFLSL